jgi:hypothetical protein
VSLLDPSAPVIGADMATTHEYFLSAVREVLYQRTPPPAPAGRGGTRKAPTVLPGRDRVEQKRSALKEAAMTSTFPPAAVPGPDDVPAALGNDDQQPDPFGDEADEEGRPREAQDDGPRPKDDPRGE